MIRLLKSFGKLTTMALAVSGLSKPSLATEAYDFTFASIDGTPLPLSQFRGKLILIVNTASLCGLTPQYEGLQTLWERYRDRGLVVIGVPSNGFGKQEPSKESEIKTFCETNFRVDFPLTTKEHVTGEEAHPFYKWAASVLGFAAKPRWNFHKYLVAPDGRLVDWFSTMTSPTSERVVEAIEAHLPPDRQAGSTSASRPVRAAR